LLFICISSAVFEYAEARRSHLVRRKKKSFFSSIKKAASKVGDAVKKGAQAVGNAVKKGAEAVEKGVEGLVDIGKKLLAKIKALAEEAKKKLMDFLNKALTQIEAKFKEFANAHKDDFGISFIFTISGEFRFEPKSPIAKKMLLSSLNAADAVVVSLALNWDADVEKTAIDFANNNGIHLFAYVVLDVAGKAPKDHKLANLCFPNVFVFGFNFQTKKPSMIGEGDFTKLPTAACLKKLLVGELGQLPGIKEILAIPGAKKILGI